MLWVGVSFAFSQSLKGMWLFLPKNNQWKKDMSSSRRERKTLMLLEEYWDDRCVGVGTNPYSHYTTHFMHTKQTHAHNSFDKLKHCMVRGGHRRSWSFFKNLFYLFLFEPASHQEALLQISTTSVIFFAVFVLKVNPQ